MKTMTKRKRPQHFTGLKVFLAAGGLAATLIGTQLLANQDTAVMPQSQPASIQQTTIAAPDSNAVITLDLAPIPQAYTPNIRPVARTTSSG